MVDDYYHRIPKLGKLCRRPVRRVESVCVYMYSVRYEEGCRYVEKPVEQLRQGHARSKNVYNKRTLNRWHVNKPKVKNFSTCRFEAVSHERINANDS